MKAKVRAALLIALVAVLIVGQCAPLSAAAANRPRPTSIRLAADTLSLMPGTTFCLDAKVLPAGALQKVIWKSDAPKIAKVSKAGVVTAVSPGITTITCATPDKKLKAFAQVFVRYNFADTQYRFFGIFNYVYQDRSLSRSSAEYDKINLVSGVYSKLKFGGKSVEEHTYENLTANEMRQALKTMSSDYGITPDDVTIFCYSGYAQNSSQKRERGGLCGTDYRITADATLSVDEVQYYLDRVPGTVVVLLECNLSGQFIVSKNGSTSVQKQDPDLFNAEWVRSFATSRATNYTSKALTNSAVKSKYKIMTSSSPVQAAHALSNYDTALDYDVKYGLFSFACMFAMKPDASDGYHMNADTNNDGIVSLKEAFKAVKSAMTKKLTAYNKQHRKSFKQNVMYWPQNDGFAIAAYTAG